jgi:pimeloyl-ACP methyl ester carboxylesterase
MSKSPEAAAFGPPPRSELLWALVTLAVFATVIVVGLSFEALAEKYDSARYPPPGNLVDVGGYRLHLLCKGTSSGPVVVMVAGGGTPAVVSYPMQDRIAEHARVCSYDRAGLGWSDAAPMPLTFDDQVANLQTMLRQAHIPAPYVFAPESFGSLVVIAYAKRHPEQVAGIAFLDGVEPQLWFQGMVNESGVFARLKGTFIQAAWRLGIVRIIFPALVPEWFDALTSPAKAQMTALYSRPNPGYAEALRAYETTPVSQRPYLAPGALGNRPVIALRHARRSQGLSAEFEAGWPSSQDRLAHLSQAGVVVVATGADHQIAQEEPELAARTVLRVLEQVGPKN